MKSTGQKAMSTSDTSSTSPAQKKAESSKAGEGIITFYNKFYVQY